MGDHPAAKYKRRVRDAAPYGGAGGVCGVRCRGDRPRSPVVPPMSVAPLRTGRDARGCVPYRDGAYGVCRGGRPRPPVFFTVCGVMRLWAAGRPGVRPLRNHPAARGAAPLQGGEFWGRRGVVGARATGDGRPYMGTGNKRRRAHMFVAMANFSLFA